MAPQAQTQKTVTEPIYIKKSTSIFLSHLNQDRKENDHIKQEEEACCNFLKAANKLKYPNLP